MTDELLFKNLDFIESFRVPYCIINNTLLSLYRNQKPFNGTKHQTVFLMWVKDRGTMYGHPARQYVNGGVTENTVIDLNEKICINFMLEEQGRLVINANENKFFVMRREMILPFGTLVYKGRSIPIPREPEAYLAYYYGDWQHPIPEERWDWVYSKGIVCANSVAEAVREQAIRDKRL